MQRPTFNSCWDVGTLRKKFVQLSHNDIRHIETWQQYRLNKAPTKHCELCLQSYSLEGLIKPTTNIIFITLLVTDMTTEMDHLMVGNLAKQARCFKGFLQ
jgi:hypothetical protein